MAQVVNFDELPAEYGAVGLRRAPITSGQTRFMSAELITLDSGATFTDTVPLGSDAYLFMLSGTASITVDGDTRELLEQTAAVIGDGHAYEVTGAKQGARLIAVIAPPAGSEEALLGFAGSLHVIGRAEMPAVELPEQKKRRLYIVGKESAASERGHAMIVEYEAETVTVMHHHPNADSMFVPLDGEFQFSVDGRDVVVGPGGAAVFAAGDRHSVCCAEGTNGGNFLEFHVPAAFTTVKE